MLALAWALMLACTTPDPGSKPVDAPEDPTTPESTPVPAAASTAYASPTLAMDCGHALIQDGTVRILTPRGAVRVEPTEPGRGTHEVTHDALMGLPPGEEISFPRAPANQAATVERASWRLAEVLGPREGLVPGGADESDPALHQGIRVHSVRKTRRQGPPMLVAVGARGHRVAIALLDRDASEIYDAVVLPDTLAPCEDVGATPLWDLDGDGTRELVVWARSQQAFTYVGYSVEEGARPLLHQIMVADGLLTPCP